VETPNREVYAFFCAISMVGIEAPSILLKGLEIAAVIEDRHVLANAKFSGFATAASTIFCASSEEMLYFFTTLANGLTPHLICTAYALGVDRCRSNNRRSWRIPGGCR